jgi:hypothetical protein
MINPDKSKKLDRFEAQKIEKKKIYLRDER